MKITKTFVKNVEAINKGYRYVLNQGSTRSGKSFAAMQINILRRILYPNTRSIVAGVTLDIVKSISLRDLKNILGDKYNVIGKYNVQDKTYVFNNLSEIKFISAENPEKFHGVDSYEIYLDEPNIWKEPDVLIQQLSIRCEGFLMLMLNPSRKLKWLDNLQKREDTILIHSTYKDNTYLHKRIIYEIEERAKIDEVFKAVYMDGLYLANTELSVFKNWSLVDHLPAKESCKWVIYGLDFGWSNNQTALAELRFYDGNLYVKEHLYKLEQTPNDIYEVLKNISEPIICDNSEPRLLTGLKKLGIKNIKKTRKPKGSKKTNISQLQNIKIFIHSKSVNLKTEFEMYQFKKINGEVTDTIVEKNDHLIDAILYGWRKKVMS